MQNLESAPDQSELALHTLALLMLIGPVALFIYAFESKSWAQLLISFGTGLSVAAGSVFVGGLFGFLFGIPRTSQQTPPAGGAGNTTASVQANTNLEQISDWLTKILVGVGLTQVRQIGDKLYALSGGVAWGLSNTNGNHSFALSLILFYLIAGFLFAYLWTRIYLPGAFRIADRAELDSLTAKVEEADQRSKDAQATSLGTGKGDTEEVKKKLLEVTDGIEPGDPNDPWKGRFGGKSVNNDRQLRAEVKPIPGSSGLFAIRLAFSSLHPESNPLKGVVQFFLHPTFNDSKPVVTAGPNGIAELNLKAWGAFTVGAVADDGQTKLELDLAEVETAPPEFRSR